MKHATLLSTLAILIAGCSSPSEPPVDHPSSSGGQNNDGKGSTSGGTNSSSGTTPPPPPNPASGCPDLSGKFGGAISGKVTSTLVGDVDITGSVAVALLKQSDSDFKAQDGSQMVIQYLGQSQAQPITGLVKCGAMDMENDNTQSGITMHVSAKCTFTASGCQDGTWTVTTPDNSLKGGGTFKALKGQ
jgi:hypothetical protein